jgi:uncharacterized protein YjdB
LTWLSSDSSKATVDSTGRVTGVAAGTTNITATYGSLLSNSSVVTVPPVTHILTSIVLSPASASVSIGSMTQLTATCKDQNTNTMTCPTLTWLSSDSSKATVDSTGRVTGVAAGTTNVWAIYGSVTSNQSVITATIPPPAEAGMGGIGIIIIAGIGITALISMKNPVTK